MVTRHGINLPRTCEESNSHPIGLPVWPEKYTMLPFPIYKWERWEKYFLLFLYCVPRRHPLPSAYKDKNRWLLWHLGLKRALRIHTNLAKSHEVPPWGSPMKFCRNAQTLTKGYCVIRPVSFPCSVLATPQSVKIDYTSKWPQVIFIFMWLMLHFPLRILSTLLRVILHLTASW